MRLVGRAVLALVACAAACVEARALETDAQVGVGRALFEGKGGCATCHTGERLGPSLEWIGALRSEAALPRSLVAPDAEIHPRFYTVVAEPMDGPAIEGLWMREDDRDVVIRDREREHQLSKAALKSLRRERRSLMPSYAERLTASERAAVVAYLRTRRTFWPLEARERSREIPLASENVPFFDRSDRAAVERTDDMIAALGIRPGQDRKSTRLNSSHT